MSRNGGQQQSQTATSPSLRTSAAYHPSGNDSNRKMSIHRYGDDGGDDDVDDLDDHGDALSLEDQRRGALQETEDNAADPDAGKPYFQTRRGKLTLAVVLIVLIVVAVIIAILVTRNNSSSAAKIGPTPSPAPFSTPRPSKYSTWYDACVCALVCVCGGRSWSSHGRNLLGSIVMVDITKVAYRARETYAVVFCY